MDWTSIAELLAEREPHPVAIVDGDLVIRGVNGAWEELFGFSRDEAVGRRWSELLSPGEMAEIGTSQLRAALRGEHDTFEAWCTDAAGAPLMVDLEGTRTGGEREPALVLVARSHRRSLKSAPISAARFRVEFDADRARFGRVRRVEVDGATYEPEPGARCYELLHGRDLPCGDCPALLGKPELWPRAAVLEGGEADGTFRLQMEQRIGSDRVEAVVTTVTEQAVGPLVQARLMRLADEARLTEREREVLGYLVLGRTADEIGQFLNVAARTVKFHQANILNKLGADSRVDLVRLLL